jgi:hypothetical protein
MFASIHTIIRGTRRGSLAGRSCRSRLAPAGGFILVETLIASVILVVALLGAFELLDVAGTIASATRAREGATNLTREILEDARTIPFSEVSPSIGNRLQQIPALAPKPPGPAWQIERRGYTYTVTVEECSIDDPKDGLGKHDSTFCPGQEEGTADAIPTDLKRVTAKVAWVALRHSQEVREVTTLSSAGDELGLSTSALKLASTTPATTIEKPTAPTITTPSVTTLTFSVTAPAVATAIVWSVDGVAQNAAPAEKTGPSEWTFSWAISGVSDGTYEIGAQAEQANGVIGPAVSIPVTLIRSVPAAPSEVEGGFNSIYVSSESAKSQAAELQWQANTERNVVGYRVYDPSGEEVCPGSPSTLSLALSCVDLSPPPMTASNLTYSVVALYRNSSGVVTEGPATKFTLVGATSNTYTLANSSGNIGTNCKEFTRKDMLLSYTPGSDVTAQNSTTFCSNAFAAGETIMFGGTLTAYFANASSTACTKMTGELLINGSIKGPAAVTKTISANTATPKAYEFAFANTGLFEPGTGGRIEVVLNWNGCNSSSLLHYNSSTYPSLFQTSPKPLLEAPQAPPSLTVTSQPDGTAILKWTAPSGGVPVSFYRIYRDGKLYTKRYDTANEKETEDVDTNRTSAHTYYITAVSSTLAESEFTGPVTG